MIKFIWRIGCLTVLLAIAFFAVSVWKGGDVFRQAGSKTGGVIQKGTKKLGEKADLLKDKADTVRDKVKDVSDRFGPSEKGLEDKKEDK